MPTGMIWELGVGTLDDSQKQNVIKDIPVFAV